MQKLSKEKKKAVTQIAEALLNAETEEDVALVSGVLSDVRAMVTMSDVEARMTASSERLAKIRRP